MRLRELGGGEVSVEVVVGESRDPPEGIGDGESEFRLDASHPDLVEGVGRRFRAKSGTEGSARSAEGHPSGAGGAWRGGRQQDMADNAPSNN